MIGVLGLLAAALAAFVGLVLGLAILRRPKAPLPPPVPAAEVRERLRPLLRPAARLFAAPDRSDFSKLGGVPDLPADLAWPVGVNGPRAFVGQFDLGALALTYAWDDLPRCGRLFAFYDGEQVGAADCVVLLYTPESQPPTAITFAAKVGQATWPELPITFRAFTSPPPGERVGLVGEPIEDDGEPLFPQPRPDVWVGPQHQIGGWPDDIQGVGLEEQCDRLDRWRSGIDAGPRPASSEREAFQTWRLLLQIDSDERTKMNWGDGGRLYVFAQEEDLRQADFSRTVTIWQSH